MDVYTIYLSEAILFLLGAVIDYDAAPVSRQRCPVPCAFSRRHLPSS